MGKRSKISQVDYLDEDGWHLVPNIISNKKMAKNKRWVIIGIITLTLLVVLLPISYSLFKNSNEIVGNVAVPDNNYCVNNGFTKLSDCILVTENYAKSVDDAKSYIATKGTPNFTKMAPTVTYKENTTNLSDENGIISTSKHFTLGKGYTFDTSTGMFTLTDYTNDNLNDAYIDYYTCGGTTSTYNSCPVLYQIKKYTKITSETTVTYKITSAIRHDYNIVDALDSEIGLYSSNDENGTSYYYRGNVKNNYVSYAGYIWRIIRENGDGSVRMIYSGTKTSDTDESTSISTNQFNSKYFDPTYVGYKYNENFALNETDNTSAGYNNFQENVAYYFGEGYIFDATTKKFKLTGKTISGKWMDIHTQAIASYPYTCFSTSATGTCDVMKKTISCPNEYTATVNFISNSSKDYNSTLLNTTDSAIKVELEKWYETNILNKKDKNGELYSSYISDEIFCNDRSLTSGSGYLLSSGTIYEAYTRVSSQNMPSLKCKQIQDRFSVSSTKGNAGLKYPIGLITADEVSMAGGLYNAINKQYYLYTGQIYWTMSPATFYPGRTSARGWYVNSTGALNRNGVNANYGVRPVISLSADVLISSGNGTVSNPYVVSSPGDYCVRNGFNKLSDCMLVAENKSSSVAEAKSKITAKGTPDFSQIAPPASGEDTVSGMYSTPDDDGTSYYYRGDVKNNYVSFANHIWRIIRQNGDGSVRMIYSGTKTSDTGEDVSIGNSAFNFKGHDPTYLGYKYNENFVLNTAANLYVRGYDKFDQNTVYYFGNNYTFDAVTKTFKVTGSEIKGTWPNIHAQVISSYPYTCFSTSAGAKCDVMIKISSYNEPNTAAVNLITYSSKDYNSTLLNTTDSLVKIKIDQWYEDNILNRKDENNNSYASYLSDGIFCNDRTIDSGDGYGYLLNRPTQYGPYARVFVGRNPILECKQAADTFSVSTSKGNGSLKYPIGLITIDEAAMAGGVWGIDNVQYYLYTGREYWTASAYRYRPMSLNASIFRIYGTGTFGSVGASYSQDVRPVINMSTDVLISGGDGTALNPYTVKLV